MLIKEISRIEFDSFSKNHPLGTFYQTSMYGEVMSKCGYTDIYIGGYLNDTLVAASLILSKTISLNVKYGYAPRGFILDYSDLELLNDFSRNLRKFFNKRNYAFIKINPMVIYSDVNVKDNTKKVNEVAVKIFDSLVNNKYQKLKNNIYFESSLPKYNPILNLKNFSFDRLDRKLQINLEKIGQKGLNIYKGDIYNLNDLYELTKRKESLSPDFYKYLYKTFSDKNMIDLFLVNVTYHDYLEHLQDEIIIELDINEKLNKIFQQDPSNKQVYNEKMLSDKKLNEINVEMADVNEKILKGINSEIVAGALVIKYKNVATVFTSGFVKDYKRLLPNHYLHYMIINKYKQDGYYFMDLNGITGDNSKNNPYKGLNDFKLSWNPKVYEYIGEFDFVISQNKYALLWSTHALHREFDKKDLKIPDEDL